ncbi:MAG: DNA replication/repair protein RecF [Gammaproteobacteria bacterium]|nr:DNA replication/repair protein RecF [Gammaproteobacteria bacterium]MDH4315614.1 DNA replication/repair protein RecF [Gammaproteobacteria bacterium]MDH5214829.1 DNA replication/repair protein RecF [Gammaproteobacteria bacterium]MDH5499501.1 DNA replication/repair protein RecF [Gammaproteobacteria bacterium]
MPLIQLSITDFRCLASAEFLPGPANNLIFGANASGKTSLLEAIAYLGRGRSFRGASTSGLIRHGSSAFVLVGKIGKGGRTRTVGVRNSRDGLELQIDGDRGAGAADLAEALPLQLIDPDIHNLVAGGPDERRRYLDWMAFHVEPGYLEAWRRLRRALKQRNAALRGGAGSKELLGWDKEFCAAASDVDRGRERVLDTAIPVLKRTGAALLGGSVDFEYRRGWSGEGELRDALAAGLERDRLQGLTQHGPHRADLRLVYDERQARKLVSRGQQKLLSCSMVLAATEVVQVRLGRPLLLLLDDPAAELDGASLGRLMAAVAALNCQVIATALDPDVPLFDESPTLFHVEQGALKAAP